MSSLFLSQTTNLKLKTEYRLIHMLKIAEVMDLPEKEFGETISKLESDPLFRKFINPPNESQQIFGYTRFPRTGFTTNVFDNQDDQGTGSYTDRVIGHDQSTADLEIYLNEKKDLIQLCQKIGIENFKSYFLYNDGRLPLESIADKCGLSTKETQEAMNVVDRLALIEEFESPAGTDASLHQRFNLIAKIDKEQDDLKVNFTSVKYARGRYTINYEKIESLKKDGSLTKDELKKLKEIINTIELLNTRKSTIFKILEKIIDRQKAYFETQDPAQLRSLSQLEMGREFDLHGSTISRAISGKSVTTPWGEEVPIKFFLVKGPVNKIKSAIFSLMSEEEKDILSGNINLPYRDDEIRNILKIRLKINIATRTIAKYRSELGITNVYQRAESYKLN